MSDPLFFGYGSLVNRQTHDYDQPRKARVRGWRRAWQATPLRALSYLTVVPAVDDYVEGLIAAVPGADWVALDERERAYARLMDRDDGTHANGQEREVAIYAIPDPIRSAPTDENPVLLSYIDVVVQGYLAEFGIDGALHFFETTDGWQAPVINDRAAPIYPRSQVLSAEEQDFVDRELARLGVKMIEGQGQPKPDR